MKVVVAVLLVLGLCFLPGHSLQGQAVSGTGEPTFLDLPDGFGQSEEEEEEPEIVEFYADNYEGDAFYFVLDRSSSMGGTTASGEVKFAVLKRETIRALQGLTSRSKVSIVFYDKSQDPLTKGDPPLKMDAGNKAAMVGFVSGTPISSGSCMNRGAEKALGIANKDTGSEHQQLVITADGRTHCDGTEIPADTIASRILAKNTRRIPINTVYTGATSGDDWLKGKPLLERLSRSTNGKFKVAR